MLPPQQETEMWKRILDDLKVLKDDLTTLKSDIGDLKTGSAVHDEKLSSIAERVGDAVLGVVIQAIEDAGAAVGAGGMSVSLDAALVADIKAILPAIKAAAKPVPPAVVAPAPVAA